MTQDLSAELQAWAKQAGFELTPSDSSGAAIFWTAPGGETRFYIRPGRDGWTTLHRSERGGPEQFVMATSSTPTLERYLLGLFGADIRSLRGLPRLAIPSEANEISPGFTVSEPDAEGDRTLFDRDGQPIARAHEPTLSLWLLAELSHYASASVDRIQASFEDPSGSPLFRL